MTKIIELIIVIITFATEIVRGKRDKMKRGENDNERASKKK